MKLTRIVLSCMIAAACSLPALAQKTASTPADAAFEKGDYYDAITLYKKAFSKEKSKAGKAEIVFKTAESYRKVNDYKNQEVWYEKAIKAGHKDPIAIYYLGQALKFNGKYDEAINQFNNYKREAKGDPRADIGIKSAEEAKKWKDKPMRYTVDNVSALNSKYSDFGAVYVDKTYRKVAFTSAGQESMCKGVDGGTGEKFQDVYEATVDKKNKWSTPKCPRAPMAPPPLTMLLQSRRSGPPSRLPRPRRGPPESPSKCLGPLRAIFQPTLSECMLVRPRR